jgi:exodeoxyribonuclease VII small subunit
MNEMTNAEDGIEQLGYAAALGELDAILRELEGPDVDVDRLADQVRRAAILIQLCRDRIGGARLQIDSVIADLDAEDEVNGSMDAGRGESA